MYNLFTITLLQITEALAFGAVGVLLIAVILGGSWYTRLPWGIRLFWYYLVMVLIIELLAKYHAYVIMKDNVYLLHLYTFFEFVLLLLFFRETLQLRRRARQIILWCIVGMAVALIAYSSNILFFDSEKLQRQHFQLYSKAITNFFILFFSVLFFVRFVGGHIKRDNRVLFWLYAGILTYFSGSFVIFMAINQLIRTPLNESIVLWLLNALLALVFYGIVTTGFIIQRRIWKRLQPG